MKEVMIQYFAQLKEHRGLSKESLKTTAENAQELYESLQAEYGFKMPVKNLKVAINDEFSTWETPLKDGDKIVFIPPVTGG